MTTKILIPTPALPDTRVILHVDHGGTPDAPGQAGAHLTIEDRRLDVRGHDRWDTTSNSTADRIDPPMIEALIRTAWPAIFATAKASADPQAIGTLGGERWTIQRYDDDKIALVRERLGDSDQLGLERWIESGRTRLISAGPYTEIDSLITLAANTLAASR